MSLGSDARQEAMINDIESEERLRMKLWKKRDGTDILIAEMTTGHIRNTIKFSETHDFPFAEEWVDIFKSELEIRRAGRKKRMKTLEEILKIEGIVIRLIPKVTVRVWRGVKGESTEITTNSLGGKYIIAFAGDQDSAVRFATDRNGVGDTIELAYQDYLLKCEGACE